ncbi:MAG: Holliday junction resolvase RuvX [Pseudomonadota bacterium]
MPIVSLEALPLEGPLLGIDPGSKTLGVAGCDALRLIASPLETIKRTKLAADLDALFALFDRQSAVGVVLGLPLNMDGTEGPRAQSARTFARNLMNARDLPLALQDERLSTAEAERALITADVSRARRAELIDKSAAAVILQTAIDRLANTA